MYRVRPDRLLRPNAREGPTLLPDGASGWSRQGGAGQEDVLQPRKGGEAARAKFSTSLALAEPEIFQPMLAAALQSPFYEVGFKEMPSLRAVPIQTQVMRRKPYECLDCNSGY